MMTGKLNWDVLQKLLKENQGAFREEVLNPGGIGEDCAVVKIGGEKLILTTDPVTAASVFFFFFIALSRISLTIIISP